MGMSRGGTVPGRFHNGPRAREVVVRMTRRTSDRPIRSAVAVAAGLLVLSGVACGNGESGSEGNASQTVPTSMLGDGGTQAVPPAMEFSIDELGFNRGDPDAPIRIVEFSDFGCGYCSRFHTEIYPQVEAEWIATGKVKWKYVTYVSGMFPNGLQAAYAAECTGEQGLFEPMRVLLYERQQEWKGTSGPYPIFEEYAREIGVEMESYQVCVAEERQKPRVRSGILAGARLGVRGTPSFLVDGFPLVGAQPVEIWNEILQARMDQLESAESGG